MKRIILIKEDDRREKELERRHIERLKTKWRRRHIPNKIPSLQQAVTEVNQRLFSTGMEI